MNPPRAWLVIFGATTLACGATALWRSVYAPKPKPLQTRTTPDWTVADVIRRNIRRPEIPPAVYDVRDFGAMPDSDRDQTRSIQAAIDRCFADGGGTVVVPEGKYGVGYLTLRSRVNLNLALGSRLVFDPNPDRYLPPILTRWEGIYMMGYHPLIYAANAQDVALTGQGIIDGGASTKNWWPWSGLKGHGWVEGMPKQDDSVLRLRAAGEAGIPVRQRVFAKGEYLRPVFVQFLNCSRVMIQGITVVNSPFWCLHPVNSRDVTIREVAEYSQGANNDGIDIDSCQRAVVDDCYFDTGDDCIAIKSGRDADGRRYGQPTRQVVIRNCRVVKGQAFLAVGSELSGGIEDVFVEGCYAPSGRVGWGLSLKSTQTRGGWVRRLRLRDLFFQNVGEGIITINGNFRPLQVGPLTTIISDIDARNISAVKARTPYEITGYPKEPVTGVSLYDFRLEEAKETGLVKDAAMPDAQNIIIHKKTP